MTEPALIDDQLLGAVLRGPMPPALEGRTLHTTGLWYLRLCQAALSSEGGRGALSGPFGSLPADLRERALAAGMELPAEVGLVSLRDLAPTMGVLRQRHRLNALGLEALASAVWLGAEVYLGSPSPLLQESLLAEDHTFRVLSTG